VPTTYEDKIQTESRAKIYSQKQQAGTARKERQT